MAIQDLHVDPSEVSVRAKYADGSVYNIFIFKGDVMWVSHILDADAVTQGTDVGDALNMAFDCIECLPPEHLHRPAPDEDCERHAFLELERKIENLRAEKAYFKERAMPTFEDIEKSGILKEQAAAWLRDNVNQDCRPEWNVKFIVRLAGTLSERNQFDIIEEMLNGLAEQRDGESSTNVINTRSAAKETSNEESD